MSTAPPSLILAADLGADAPTAGKRLAQKDLRLRGLRADYGSDL